MRIGEIAKRSGVTSKTMRYYESIGLLDEPDRTSSGYRNYDLATVERLRFIRDAQTSGLSLTEIASILELKDVGSSSCQHTQLLLERHLVDVTKQIEQLRSMRARLVELIERSERLEHTDCTDPQRCHVISSVD